jgi:hypothetical protein
MSDRDRKFLSHLGVKQIDLAQALKRNESTISAGLSGSDDYLNVARFKMLRQYVVCERELVKGEDFDRVYSEWLQPQQKDTSVISLASQALVSPIFSTGFVFVGFQPLELQLQGYRSPIFDAISHAVCLFVVPPPPSPISGALKSRLIKALAGRKSSSEVPLTAVLSHPVASCFPNVYFTIPSAAGATSAAWTTDRHGTLVELHHSVGTQGELLIQSLGIHSDDFEDPIRQTSADIEATPDQLVQQIELVRRASGSR